MALVEDPVSEFIISDRILQSKKKKAGSGLRTLRVSLSPDKESTVVELKEP